MAPQQSAPASCTFNDLLRILPSTARYTLCKGLWRNGSRKAARQACRALRYLIDDNTSGLCMTFNRTPEAEMLAAFQAGKWLDGRPNCTSISLLVDQENLSTLAVPFATARPEACQRITQLVIKCTGWPAPPLPGVVLLSVTARLPCLASLELDTVPPEPSSALERQLVSHALSLLPGLTSLTLYNSNYVPLIPDGLVGRLTQLSVNAPNAPGGRPSTDVLASALSKMTAAKQVLLDVPLGCPFRPRCVRRLLDSVPQVGQLQLLRLYPVGGTTNELCCTFASSGHLDTIEWNNDESYESPYSEMSEVLGTAVLPSRVMGPRLRRLGLMNLEADAGPPVPDPASELYARCDTVELVELKGCEHASAMLSYVRLFGVPEQLAWNVGLEGSTDCVYTRGAVEGGQSGAAGAGVGEADSGSARAKAPPVVLSPSEVVHRAVERMATTEGSGSDCVLLRGPLVRGLISAPPALKGWLQQVSADAVGGRVHQYRVLPSAGAVVAECDREDVGAKAVAEAARRLGDAAGGGGGGVVMVEAVHSQLTWHASVVQVLQALWDGEEDGGGDAGGAGAEAGAGGRSTTGGACTAAELERVRCLLETWKGLRAMPAAVALELLVAP